MHYYKKNETKKSELIDLFYQFEDDDEDDGKELLSFDDKKSLVKGVMTGKIIQAGIGVAMSATINKQENERKAEKMEQDRHKKISRLITVGDRRINLKNISEVEMYRETDATIGYLRFIKKNTKDDILYDAEYFFFNNSMPFESKKIKKRMEAIVNIISNIIIKEGQKKESKSKVLQKEK